MQMKCYLTCRSGRCMWDLCAMLPVEGAFIFKGGKVSKLSFDFHLHEPAVKFHNLTSLQASTYSYFTACSVTRFSLQTHSCSDKDESSQKGASHQRRTKGGLARMLHFSFVTGMLAVVGPRVASLVVLEFCLRAVSGWLTSGPVRN